MTTTLSGVATRNRTEVTPVEAIISSELAAVAAKNGSSDAAAGAAAAAAEAAAAADGVPAEDDDTNPPLDLAWPKENRKRLTYIFVMPILLPLWLTLPDTRTPHGQLRVVDVVRFRLWLADGPQSIAAAAAAAAGDWRRRTRVAVAARPTWTTPTPPPHANRPANRIRRTYRRSAETRPSVRPPFPNGPRRSGAPSIPYRVAPLHQRPHPLDGPALPARSFGRRRRRRRIGRCHRMTSTEPRTEPRDAVAFIGRTSAVDGHRLTATRMLGVGGWIGGGTPDVRRRRRHDDGRRLSQ